MKQHAALSEVSNNHVFKNKVTTYFNSVQLHAYFYPCNLKFSVINDHSSVL